ncbi:hypothetical protein CFter6_3205 [Collimonas fungivorans]|uniref:Uncharacterized protein n=1 Tax=Collimonas fungivorans TaxID=158899 RepID=A0A127PDQ6_9BURK|nr:hypothetical protein CFter6_3205 [Collimonas fungivorans]
MQITLNCQKNHKKNNQKNLSGSNIHIIQASNDAASQCQTYCRASIFFIKLSYSMHTLRRNHQTSCLIHE